MSQPTKTVFKAEDFAFDSLAYRAEQRLSRKKFAPLIGTTPHVVNHYENRENRPKKEVVEAFCELLGCEINKYYVPA